MLNKVIKVTVFSIVVSVRSSRANTTEEPVKHFVLARNEYEYQSLSHSEYIFYEVLRGSSNPDSEKSAV